MSLILKIGRLLGCTLAASLAVTGCATAPSTPTAAYAPATGVPRGANATEYNAALKDEYRQIFTQVLEKFFASKAKPNICLPPLFGFGDNVSETVDVNPELETQFPGLAGTKSRPEQFKALEAAGLVSSVESTRTLNNKAQRVLTYRRTAKGLASSDGPSICYARGELDHVVKWKGPVVLGEYRAAFVYYTVKTTHIDDWVKSADIQAAFPTTVPIVKGEAAKVRSTVIDLSSEGWDIADYSKYLQLQ